jgi:4-oxalocrotonate tautomerase family enzyme
MAVVTVDWLDGRSPQQKEELVAAITDAMHRLGGAPLDNINVILRDIPAGNWGRGGEVLKQRPAANDRANHQSASKDEGLASPLTTNWVPSLDHATRIFDLEQPRIEGMPVIDVHRPGYLYVLHRRHGDAAVTGPAGPRSSASGMIVCMEHSGTHIDAICHQADDGQLFGGIPAAEVSTAKGFLAHGIETVPPLIGRGVLLDLPRQRGGEVLEPGAAVTAAELEACAEAQGSTIRPGDTVLVRTGNGRVWDEPERYLAGPGMAASASRWLAEQGVVAVGADNMAWDVIGLVDEELGCQLPGHLILLARHGIYIIENLLLEELADAQVQEFGFVCTPLKFVGATGSPVRPIAIVSDEPND